MATYAGVIGSPTAPQEETGPLHPVLCSAAPPKQRSIYTEVAPFPVIRGLQMRISPGVPSARHCLPATPMILPGRIHLASPCPPMLSPLTWDREGLLLQVMPGLPDRESLRGYFLCSDLRHWHPRWVSWILSCLPSLDWPAA